MINARRELLGFLSEKNYLHFTMDCKYHSEAPETDGVPAVDFIYRHVVLATLLKMEQLTF